MVLRHAIAFGMVALVGVAAWGDDEAPPTEFEGRWIARELESAGEKDDPMAIRRFEMKATGDRVDFRPTGVPLWRALFRVDRTTVPYTIHFTRIENGAPGRTVTGIFKVEEGMWTLCVPNFDSDVKGPPRAFKTEPGDGLVLMKLVRLVPKK
jgi:uncharacterized protein (TIGR03067 family)